MSLLQTLEAESRSVVPRAGGSDGAVEFGWFTPCSNDDCYQLGVPAPELAATPERLLKVIKAVEDSGFQNILIPSSFNSGVDAWTLAAYVASHVKRLRLLPAVRVGEQHLPMFARAAANLDRMLEGRLNVNIISSPLAGLPEEPSAVRYRGTQEFMHVLKQFWTSDHVKFSGEYYNFDLPARLPKTVQADGPPLYFGGLSPAALEAAAAEADVYLFWGDTVPAIRQGIARMRELAAAHGRALLYGMRIHVIARATNKEAVAAAQHLIEHVSPEIGAYIKSLALDKNSVGKARQNDLVSQGEWAEPYLWTGIGRARAGVGTALVGSYDQVEERLRAYMAEGIQAFILSGYPHLDEAVRFGEHLLPRFLAKSCAEILGRIGATSNTG